MPRALQFAVFLAVILIVLVGSHLYFHLRLVRNPAPGAPWRQVATWTLVALGASVPLVFLLSRVLPHAAARAVLFVPYVWIGMMLLLAFFLLCADLLKLLAWVGLKLSGHGDYFADTARRLLRDRIVAGVVLATTLVLTVVSVRNGLAAPAVRRVRVVLDKLPASLDGFRLVQLTDLHLGPTLHRDFLEDVVERTNALEPDLVVITGDLVDASVEHLLPALKPLGELRAAHGVYFSTGNHEYYAGLDEWLPAIEGLGVRVLYNRRVPIEADGAGFDLAGVPDPTGRSYGPGRAPDLEGTLAGRDPVRPVILLAHQSVVIDEASRAGVDLVLSGHNHGGQIWPWMHLVGLQQPYVSGLHRHDGTAIYVSEGTGFWGPPMRLGTRSEIALIVLSIP